MTNARPDPNVEALPSLARPCVSCICSYRRACYEKCRLRECKSLIYCVLIIYSFNCSSFAAGEYCSDGSIGCQAGSTCQSNVCIIDGMQRYGTTNPLLYTPIALKPFNTIVLIPANSACGADTQWFCADGNLCDTGDSNECVAENTGKRGKIRLIFYFLPENASYYLRRMLTVE